MQGSKTSFLYLCCRGHEGKALLKKKSLSPWRAWLTGPRSLVSRTKKEKKERRRWGGNSFSDISSLVNTTCPAAAGHWSIFRCLLGHGRREGRSGSRIATVCPEPSRNIDWNVNACTHTPCTHTPCTHTAHKRPQKAELRAQAGEFARRSGWWMDGEACRCVWGKEPWNWMCAAEKENNCISLYGIICID